MTLCIVAYSSQYTDDNDSQYSIFSESGQTYNNYISQTINILKPKKDLMRIYPVFHFVPGTSQEIFSEGAFRADGKLHLLNTTPNNENAKNILQAAFNSKNLYRIGIATHAYCDTFSHQNFVGYFDSFNGMGGILDRLKPNIGHADAVHKPDWPAIRWKDERLVSSHKEIDNKKRFLEAAKLLLDFYCENLSSSVNRKKIIKELDEGIGDNDNENLKVEARIENYKSLIGPAFKDYKQKDWFKDAVGSRRVDNPPNPMDSLTQENRIEYFWKDNYKESHWYTFQEAVKDHQLFTMEQVLKPIFSKMELQNI